MTQARDQLLKMKKSLCLLILLAVFIAEYKFIGVASQTICLLEYRFVDGMCYRVWNGTDDWVTARGNCQRDGADLLVDHNQTVISNAVTALMTQGETYWIGLTGTVITGWPWTWVNHQSLSYNDWHGNEPSDDTRNGRDCGCFWKDYLLRWNDEKCHDRQRSICEKDSAICPLDYHSLVGKCYKVETQTMTWDDARSSCKSDGGDLALVLDGQVNTAIKGLVDQGYNHWMGLEEVFTTLVEWRWLHGGLEVSKTLANDSGVEVERTCGSWFYNGTTHGGLWEGWTGADCGTRYHYICETQAIIPTPPPIDILMQPVTKESMGYLRNVTSPPNDSTTTTTPPYKLCPCNCYKLDPNPPPEVLARIMSDIQKRLKIDTIGLSSKRNKRISAPDNRLVSKVIGHTSISLGIIIPFCLLVLNDLVKLFRYFMGKIK